MYKIISLLALFPLLVGCNDSDDVAAIFTNKTWKLTFIAKDGSDRMYDFWNNEDRRTESLRKLEMSGAFTVRFDGTVEEELIQGTVSGRTTVDQEFNGTWSANGKSREFRASVAGGESSDALVSNFLKGLSQATAYDGDSNNLYLIYEDKEKQTTFRMFFHVVR